MISKITDGMFSTASLLRKGLDAATLRQEVIANNLANADVPNFKASRVEFETLLAGALEESKLPTRRTRPGHTELGFGDVSTVRPRVVTDHTNTSMRMDGNNVDVEKETTELLKAQVYYNQVAAKLTSEYKRLRSAISGGV